MKRAPRILMLAPEPFFEPRGTPFSEYHRIKVLGELGYEVDLVTYPFGRDVSMEHLRILRSARPPFIRGVRIGPSMVKVLLDLLLAVTAFRRALMVSYDAIHSHEEAGVLGAVLSEILGIPHLYDMHSSLPQQLQNFQYSKSPLMRGLFERAERKMIDSARVVITICQELQDSVVAVGAGDRSFLIENVMGGDMTRAEEDLAVAEDVRRDYGIRSDQPLILYTGTFEEYQGLDLLTSAAACLAKSCAEARVLVVGGEPAQVERARKVADATGSPMVFAGQRPPEEIPGFIAACDILVSPRVSGTNTPLKIYSYLRSGRPIVATDLRTHTQVLTSETAVLVSPEAESLAAGLLRLIEQPEERQVLSDAARKLADTRYSRDMYVSRTAAAYNMLLGNQDGNRESYEGVHA